MTRATLARSGSLSFSPQLRVLRLSLPEDGKIGIGMFATGRREPHARRVCFPFPLSALCFRLFSRRRNGSLLRKFA